MPFLPDTWKAKVSERLREWRLRFAPARPATVYTTLSAAALWPLVQADQSDGLLPVALALGHVVAGVGGNLTVPLAGVDPKSVREETRRDLELAAVYTALMTQQTAPVGPQQRLPDHPGDPCCAFGRRICGCDHCRGDSWRTCSRQPVSIGPGLIRL